MPTRVTDTEDEKHSPLGIIAGLGDLPVNIAQEMHRTGRSVYIVRLADFDEPRLAEFPGEVVGMGEIGKQLRLLKKAGCVDVVFAGAVKRPDFAKLKFDMRGARLLPKIISGARKGDDALLRVMVDAFESDGLKVVGADEIIGNLTSKIGLIAGHKPSENNIADMRHAALIATQIGALDIGQGCVVKDGLVLAVEAQEGTDEMLRRVAGLPSEIRGGVLVKRPKPMQERRVDLPTIGVSTLELAIKAGLDGVGVEAEGALIIDKPAITTLANELGLFIYGFPKDWD